MKIELNISKKFEEHFKQDKFKDSLERIMADIKHSLENGDCLCSGRYEYETIEMLEKAFENSKLVYDNDKIADELEETKLEKDIKTKETIFVRKIDDLGRIIIPRELRRQFFGVNTISGISMEISATKDEIILRKYEENKADDMCEWRQTSKARYKTGCGYNLEEYFNTKVCYCKQCGKKIRLIK